MKRYSSSRTLSFMRLTTIAALSRTLMQESNQSSQGSSNVWWQSWLSARNLNAQMKAQQATPSITRLTPRSRSLQGLTKDKSISCVWPQPTKSRSRRLRTWCKALIRCTILQTKRSSHHIQITRLQVFKTGWTSEMLTVTFCTRTSLRPKWISKWQRRTFWIFMRHNSSSL